MLNNSEQRLAVLIDGDNAQATQIESIMKEIVKFGVVTIRRIYGDWTTPHLDSWKKKLPIHAIQPIQQFRNTVGKNATDSAMIIDAMDILYSNNVGGFVIVSSDSDYTKLVIRLREAGMEAIGIGKNHTPKSFVNACNEFRYVENIMKSYESGNNRRPTRKRDSDLSETIENNGKAGADKEIIESTEDTDLVAIVTEAHEMADQESAWVDLRKIANNLKKVDPAFDPRTYGSSKLAKIIAARNNAFEVKRDRLRQRIMVRVKNQGDQ
tara:strand:+ start:167 stop:967 length:801 start_codon:yes stop_codon:yes gene_type:complete